MGWIIQTLCSLLVIVGFTSCWETEFICQDWIGNCENLTISIDASKRNRKVLIIGIDGFRSDAMQATISPYLKNLSESSDSFFTDKHQVERLTFSGPNWASLLTGVHCKHEVTNNDFSNNQLEEFPHFFKYIEQADSSIVTASIVHWSPINEYIVFDYADHATGGTDLEIFNQAQKMLLNQDPINPDLLFLQIVDLDAAGHEFGFHPEVPEYANALTRIDGYVSELVSIINTKREQGEDWMIFVVSDHGGDGMHHHNYTNVNIRRTVFLANHPELKFLNSHLSSQVDLVPTVLDFIGITSEEFNCKTDGISLIDGTQYSKN